MNALPNFLAIAFLAVSIFISELTVDFVGAQNTAEGAASARRPADPLQSKHLKFSRLTSEEGLSNDQVWDVAQDIHGFMWFATSGGLNRYDGSGVKVYRHDPADPNSLINDAAVVVYEDRSGLIWADTRAYGLTRFDRDTGHFTNYRHNAANPRSLSNDSLVCIYEDRIGTLWIGTYGGG